MIRSLPAVWVHGWQQVTSAWVERPVMQRRGIFLAALLLASVAFWTWGLAPALATWREAPAQHQRLDVKLQSMQLQAQAFEALQGLPRADPARSAVALTESLKPLAEQAKLRQDGTRATVELQGVSAQALAEWLGSVRLSSQAVPVEAELHRIPGGSLWGGRVVLELPRP